MRLHHLRATSVKTVGVFCGQGCRSPLCGTAGVFLFSLFTCGKKLQPRESPLAPVLVCWHLEQQLSYGSGIRCIWNYCSTWVLGIVILAVVSMLVFEVWVVQLSHGTMIQVFVVCHSDSGSGSVGGEQWYGPQFDRVQQWLGPRDRCSSSMPWGWWVKVLPLAQSQNSSGYGRSEPQLKTQRVACRAVVVLIPQIMRFCGILIPESRAQQLMGSLEVSLTTVTAPALGKKHSSRDSRQLHQLGSILVKTVWSSIAKFTEVCGGVARQDFSYSPFPFGVKYL